MKKMIAIIKLFLRYVFNRSLIAREISKRWLSNFTVHDRGRKKQLIICGYPRSGTSLFYNMVTSSIQNFNVDEWETTAADSIWRYDNHASKAPVDLFCLQQITEKNIHNKEICVVILMRDVRDIITSRHQFAPDSFVIGYQGAYSFSGEYPNYKKKFDGPGIGKYYSVMQTLSTNDDINFIIVKYEDIVTNPDACQARLAKTFDIDFDGDFSSYHLRKDKHKLKYKGKHAALDKTLEKSSSAVEKKFVKRWSDPVYKDRVREQFTDYPKLFDILIEQGYEKSTDWFDEFKL